MDKEERQQTFVAHKELLCHYSPFFENAFNGQFIEAKTQTMEMEDINSDVVGLLIHWLYTQNIEFDEEDEAPDSVANLLPLAKLWTLADLCLIPTLQNAAATLIHPLLKCAESTAVKEFSEYAYETEGNIQLKRMIVDKLAWFLSAKELERWMREGKLSGELFIGVVVALKKGKPQSSSDPGDAKDGEELCAEDYFVRQK